MLSVSVSSWRAFQMLEVRVVAVAVWVSARITFQARAVYTIVPLSTCLQMWTCRATTGVKPSAISLGQRHHEPGQRANAFLVYVDHTSATYPRSTFLQCSVSVLLVHWMKSSQQRDTKHAESISHLLPMSGKLASSAFFQC